MNGAPQMVRDLVRGGMGQIAAVVPDDFSGPEHQLRSGMAQILHQLHISLHAGGDAACMIQPQPDCAASRNIPGSEKPATSLIAEAPCSRASAAT